MAYRFTAADIAYLDSEAGAVALGAAVDMPLTDATLLADLTRLRQAAGGFAAPVAETVRLRRRARARWGDGPAGAKAVGPMTVAAGPGAIGQLAASRWLFTDEALQQASPPPVAAHRAARLAAANCAGVHDLTCSIGTDLAAFTAAGLFAIGSDIDAVRLGMARHNLDAVRLPARLIRADARTCTSRGLIRYADPARRDASGRRISSTDTIPTVGELDAADPAQPPVLRLPPGIDFERLNRPGEIEIVSWRGTVREAVSWPPPLAAARRRATVLADDGSREQYTDADPAEGNVIDSAAAGRYLIDPDPAVVRAHLVQQYAARYGLARFDEHLAYLTGDTPPPRIRSFEILDIAPFAEQTVRSWLRRDGAGTVEIKQRGTPLVPDELRRRLRPRGDRHIERTLVIARIGRGPVAFWCRAVPATRRAASGADGIP